MPSYPRFPPSSFNYGKPCQPAPSMPPWSLFPFSLFFLQVRICIKLLRDVPSYDWPVRTSCSPGRLKQNRRKGSCLPSPTAHPRPPASDGTNGLPSFQPARSGQVDKSLIQTLSDRPRVFFASQSFFPLGHPPQEPSPYGNTPPLPGPDTPALMVIFRIFQRFFQESYGHPFFPFPPGRVFPQLNMAKYGPLQEFPLRLHGFENTVLKNSAAF